MKMKTILLVNVLLLVVSTNIQAMGGARDFARKLFLSKTAALAGAVGCISGAGEIDKLDSKEHLIREHLTLAKLPFSAEKMIKEIFARDGIDIKIFKHPDNTIPASVFSHKGKNFLFLSDQIINKFEDSKSGSGYKCNLDLFLEGYTRVEKINEQFMMSDMTVPCEKEKKAAMFFEGIKRICDDQKKQVILFEKIFQGPFDDMTKDEIFAALEHEKSHIKDCDGQKRSFLSVMHLPFIILTMKIVRLHGMGRLATGFVGLAQMPINTALHFAYMRQQEKKCDLSLPTSKSALDLANVFEKAGNIDNQQARKNIKLDSLFAKYPPHLERARYLRDHAQQLEHKEQQAKNRKM